MISETQRSIANILFKLRLWRFRVLMTTSCMDVIPARGTKWILNWMLKTQKVDNLHHAPACPANHYHRTRIVYQTCTCGAKQDHQP
jgi:hypothetical protein